MFVEKDVNNYLSAFAANTYGETISAASAKSFGLLAANCTINGLSSVKLKLVQQTDPSIATLTQYEVYLGALMLGLR